MGPSQFKAQFVTKCAARALFVFNDNIYTLDFKSSFEILYLVAIVLGDSLLVSWPLAFNRLDLKDDKYYLSNVVKFIFEEFVLLCSKTFNITVNQCLFNKVSNMSKKSISNFVFAETNVGRGSHLYCSNSYLIIQNN